MSSRKIVPMTDDILRECPRFRILLVGKSGVGKSSLIGDAFNVDMKSVSNQERGICDIETEITSDQNPRFVVHDSQGFEPGEVDNFNRVKNFIQAHGEGVELKNRIHAVWLCVQIPFAGGRVFEAGDEQFLQLGLKVPIIVVFTKFDKLITRQIQCMTKDERGKGSHEIESISVGRAEEAFQRSCVDQLQKVGPRLRYAKVSVKPQHRKTLTELINLTQELVSHEIEGDVWIVSAMAQRASAQAKINSSIQVGMKQYWQSLASSTRLSGSTLKECLSIIHTDITSSWNFNDPSNLLDGEDFREKIAALAQLITPEDKDLSSWFSEDLETIQSLIGVTSSLAAAIAPPIAVIGLSAMFMKWMAGQYRATPEVLRCLMGYIIDLTLVMDQLFLNTLPIKPPRLLDLEQVDLALEDYKNTTARQVHYQIREYAKKSTFTQILVSNNAQQKVIELIQQHRVGCEKPLKP